MGMAAVMHWMIAVVTTWVLLAGCSDAPVDVAVEPADTVPLDTGGPEGPDPGPDWAVGDHFGHHVYFGAEDTEGEHINAIVVEDLGTAWRLASDSERYAKFEATYGVPVLGELSKDDLSTTAFGGQWDVYDFPITDGKTWNGTIDMDLFGLSYEIEFEATYAASIPFAGGEAPGYTINGTVGGQRLIMTDWVPELGWYTQFYFYDLATEDPDDHHWLVRSMGAGHNWTGTYHWADATLKADLQQEIYPEGAGLVAEPDPHASFEVPEDATHIVGFAYAFAYAGAAKTELVAPDGTRYGPAEVVDGGDSASAFAEYDLDAQAGAWEAAILNGGVASGGGLRVWSVELTSIGL